MASVFTAPARNANNANPAKAGSPDSSALSFGGQRPPRRCACVQPVVQCGPCNLRWWAGLARAHVHGCRLFLSCACIYCPASLNKPVQTSFTLLLLSTHPGQDPPLLTLTASSFFCWPKMKVSEGLLL